MKGNLKSIKIIEPNRERERKKNVFFKLLNNAINHVHVSSVITGLTGD